MKSPVLLVSLPEQVPIDSFPLRASSLGTSPPVWPDPIQPDCSDEERSTKSPILHRESRSPRSKSVLSDWFSTRKDPTAVVQAKKLFATIPDWRSDPRISLSRCCRIVRFWEYWPAHACLFCRGGYCTVFRQLRLKEAPCPGSQKDREPIFDSLARFEAHLSPPEVERFCSFMPCSNPRKFLVSLADGIGQRDIM